MQRFILLSTIILIFQAAVPDCSTVYADDSTKNSPAKDDQLSDLLKGLASEDFQSRVQASKKLKQLPPEELRKLVTLASKEPSAEALIRLLAEVDDRYASEDEKNVDAASAALENLAEGNRQLTVDNAETSLTHHWARRVALAIKTLEHMGAVVKKGDFAPGGGMFGVPQASPSLQVLIGEKWTGGDQGIEVFERFSNLTGPAIRGSGGLVVYLLDGHPLTEKQRSSLTDLVGANRIAERSRVALGIRGSRTTAESVLISYVSKGGAAFAAGLQTGDLIVAINNPDREKLTDEELAKAKKAELLRDFDDLIERLKQYRAGDVIELRVIREFTSKVERGPDGSLRPRRNIDLVEEVVPVTLKGWEELEAR